jgi:hypothetical protein
MRLRCSAERCESSRSAAECAERTHPVPRAIRAQIIIGKCLASFLTSAIAISSHGSRQRFYCLFDDFDLFHRNRSVVKFRSAE